MDWSNVIIIFMVVVMPIWLGLHYLTQLRAGKGLSREYESMLSELWEEAHKMESRVQVLESILDDELPGWRKKV